MVTFHLGTADQSTCEKLVLSDEMDVHREVWEMCAALGKLEAERGNESVFACLRERACNKALFIAEHAGTPELREIFLSRTDVHLVVGT